MEADARCQGRGLELQKDQTRSGEECVLLIEADADVAAEILAELNSATEERFHVEWIAELSSGVERLGNRGVGAVVLDLTSPDSHGVETFNKLFLASSRVPVLLLTEVDAEKMARQAVQRGAHAYVFNNQSAGYRIRGQCIR